jgi:hypothetical protein
LTGHRWLGYEIKERRTEADAAYLRSKPFERLRDPLLCETGSKIAAPYFAVEPSSAKVRRYDAGGLRENPNYATIDSYVASRPQGHFLRSYLVPFVGASYKRATLQRQEFSERLGTPSKPGRISFGFRPDVRSPDQF